MNAFDDLPKCLPLPKSANKPSRWRCVWKSGKTQLTVKDMTAEGAQAFCTKHGLSLTA